MENAEEVYSFFLKKYKYVHNEVMALRKVLGCETKKLKDILKNNTFPHFFTCDLEHWFKDVYEYAHDLPLDPEIYRMSVRAGLIDYNNVSWADEISKISKTMAALPFDAVFLYCRDILWRIIDTENRIVRLKFGMMHRGLEFSKLADLPFLPKLLRKILQYFVDSAVLLKPDKKTVTKISVDEPKIVRICQDDSSLEGLEALMKAGSPVSITTKAPELCKLSQDFSSLLKAYDTLNLYIALFGLILAGQNGCAKEYTQAFLHELPYCSEFRTQLKIKTTLNTFYEFVKEFHEDDHNSKEFWKRYDDYMCSLKFILEESMHSVFKEKVQLIIKLKDPIELVYTNELKEYVYLYGPHNEMKLKMIDILLKKTASLTERHNKIDKYFIHVTYPKPESKMESADKVSIKNSSLSGTSEHNQTASKISNNLSADPFKSIEFNDEIMHKYSDSDNDLKSMQTATTATEYNSSTSEHLTVNEKINDSSNPVLNDEIIHEYSDNDSKSMQTTTTVTKYNSSISEHLTINERVDDSSNPGLKKMWFCPLCASKDTTMTSTDIHATGKAVNYGVAASKCSFCIGKFVPFESSITENKVQSTDETVKDSNEYSSVINEPHSCKPIANNDSSNEPKSEIITKVHLIRESELNKESTISYLNREKEAISNSELTEQELQELCEAKLVFDDKYFVSEEEGSSSDSSYEMISLSDVEV